MPSGMCFSWYTGKRKRGYANGTETNCRFLKKDLTMDKLNKHFIILEVVLLIICAMFMLLAFSACTTTKYVPIIEHHTDTLIQTKVVHDSIHVKDSTHVSEKQKGDTLLIEREMWHTKFVYRDVHDTLYVSKTDSVPKPYPVETIKEVEKKLSTMQVVLMTIGGLTIMALFVFIVVKLKRFLPCR